MIGKAIMRGFVFVTPDDQLNWTDISSLRSTPECPFWVISLHVSLKKRPLYRWKETFCGAAEIVS